MKLIAKNEQTPEGGKARNGTKAKKAAARASEALKSKRADPVRKTDASKKTVKRSGEVGKSFIDIARDYLRDVVAELKKVTWPTRKETLGSTGVILIIVFLTSIFLGLVDAVLSKVLHYMVH